MREKGRVRKFPETGRIVRHHICWAQNVLKICIVTEVALVEATDPKEVGTDVTCGDGAFGRAGDSRCIIIEDRDGSFADVKLLSQDILVSHDAREFEVTVGEVPRRVVIGDKPVDNVIWKWFAPNYWLFVTCEPDSPHTTAGGINGTDS